MISRSRHIRDEGLFERYMAERNGDVVEPGLTDHLADCHDCAARYRDFAAVMDRLRTNADAETDLAFDAERLRVQQQQIQRRLEHLGQVARVLSFPVRVGRRVSATAARVAPRWIAGAAAAGLFVGVAAGRIYDLNHPMWQPPPVVNSAPQLVVLDHQAVRSEPVIADMVDMADDDVTFMSELEMSLEHQRTRELISLDEMTPHVSQLADTMR